MTMYKRLWPRLLAALIVCVMIAASCGDGGDTGAADGPAAPDEQTAPAGTATEEQATDEQATDEQATDEQATDEQATDEPATDMGPTGRLVWALPSNGANFFDPHKATNPFVRSWIYPFYDRLTQIDGNGDVQPMLATAWAFAADGSSLTFTLREGVTFHDGTAFDAEAAKANLDRARDPSIARGTFIDFLAVDSVDVVDPLTVRLNLKGPGGALPALLSDQAGMMISPAGFDNENLATMPVGAGPFVATEFRVDEAMHAVAFEDYWDPALPKVAELELRLILDPTTRLNAIASGEAHGGYHEIGLFSRADATDLGLELTERFSTALYQLFINTALVPELANPDVRVALAMSVDQEAFGQALYNGECTPTDQPFGEGWYARNPDIDADHHPYDPEAARAMLETAGAGDLEFTAITANLPSFVAGAEAIQGFLAQVGVTMHVAPTPIPELIAGFLVNRTAQAYWTVNPGAADPAKIVGTMWLPPSPFNPGGNVVPGLLELHVQAQASNVPSERAPAYHEMSRLLADQQPSIMVCTPANIMAHRADVTGVQLLSTASDVDVSRISVAG